MKFFRYFFLRLFLLSAILLIFSVTFSQPVDWKRSPDKTFVFNLNDKQALKLLKGRFKPKDWDKVLQAPSCSFTKKWTDHPSKGHFIYANILRNSVNYRYNPIMPFQVFMFKEYGALTVQIVDDKGTIRKDAKVRLGHSTLSYDTASQTYTAREFPETATDILTVKLDKFQAVFEVSSHPVSSWYSPDKNEKNVPHFYSYLITDKNKYKPGEKVRFKSYALSRNRRPLKQQLSVWLQTKGYNYKKILTLSPYHQGGYAGEFDLADSLQLSLDRQYKLQLRNDNGRIIASTNFRYEDYELSGWRLQAELESMVQYKKQPNRLKIMATDVNGLALEEMKIQVTVLRRSVLRSYTDLLTLPDTLLARTVTLNESGQGEVEIPSGIFGLSDCAYDVKTLLLTPDNERIEQLCQATFYHSRYEVRSDTKADSLYLSFLDQGTETPVEAELTNNDTKEKRKIRLPFTEKFSQSVSGYWLEVADYNFSEYIATAHLAHHLTLEGGLEADSLKVQLLNPLKIDVSWYVYQGNLLLEKGTGKECNIRIGGIDHRSAHYVEVFFFMGNEEQSVRKVYKSSPDNLTVTTDLPARIYPGQTVDATLYVKDASGLPVKNADITAFAVNSQLEYNLPDLPSYGDEPKAREQRTSYSMRHKENLHQTRLDYNHWNTLAGLDRLPYYQFTYPGNKLFTYTTGTPDNTTQFAPYVMKNGEAVDIQVIEIDDRPCYFSWTNQPKAYSFMISDELHKISLRLHDRVLIIDSLKFQSGRKTILSMDMDDLPENITVLMLGNKFTPEEKARCQKYICSLPIPQKMEYAYLENTLGGKLPVYLEYARPYRNNLVAGPVEPGYMKYTNGVTYRHEGGFAYEFEGNVVYKYATDFCPATLHFSSNAMIDNLNDFYYTPMVFRSLLDQYRRQAAWHPSNIRVVVPNKNLNIHLPVEEDATGVGNLVFKHHTTDLIYCPSLTIRREKNLEIPAGQYDVLVIYNNGKYLRRDNVGLRNYSYMDIDMGATLLQETDSLSWQYLSMERYSSISNNSNSREIYLERKKSSTNNRIRGYVYDDNDEPLIGATIMEKDTKNGTVTDLDGYFELSCTWRDVYAHIQLCRIQNPGSFCNSRNRNQPRNANRLAKPQRNNYYRIRDKQKPLDNRFGFL